MTIYRVTLINVSRNFRQTIAVADDECILDQAAEQGIEVPHECTSGGCAVCQGRIVSGTVDQSVQVFLSDHQITEGYILPCVAKPTSDCTIEVELARYL